MAEEMIDQVEQLSTLEIWEALAECQAAIENPVQDTTGQIGNLKYKYARLGQIRTLIREPLRANGLSITHHLNEEGVYSLQTFLRHVSGENLTTTIPLPFAPGKDLRELMKGITLGMRYNICALLNIAADEDNDEAGTTQATPAEPVETLHPDEVTAIRVDLEALGMTPEEFLVYYCGRFDIELVESLDKMPTARLEHITGQLMHWREQREKETAEEKFDQHVTEARNAIDGGPDGTENA